MDLYLSAQADHFMKCARTFCLVFVRAFPVSRASRADLCSSTPKVGGPKDIPAPPPKKVRGPWPPLAPPMPPPLHQLQLLHAPLDSRKRIADASCCVRKSEAPSVQWQQQDHIRRLVFWHRLRLSRYIRQRQYDVPVDLQGFLSLASPAILTGTVPLRVTLPHRPRFSTASRTPGMHRAFGCGVRAAGSSWK